MEPKIEASGIKYSIKYKSNYLNTYLDDFILNNQINKNRKFDITNFDIEFFLETFNIKVEVDTKFIKC